MQGVQDFGVAIRVHLNQVNYHLESTVSIEDLHRSNYISKFIFHTRNDCNTAQERI